MDVAIPVFVGKGPFEGDTGRLREGGGEFLGDEGPAPGVEGRSLSSTLRSFFGRIIRRLIAAAPGGSPSSSSVGRLTNPFSGSGVFSACPLIV